MEEIEEEMRMINKLERYLNAQDREMQQLGATLFEDYYPHIHQEAALNGVNYPDVYAGYLSIRAYVLGKATGKIIQDEENRKRLGSGIQNDSDDCISGQ